MSDSKIFAQVPFYCPFCSQRGPPAVRRRVRCEPWLALPHCTRVFTLTLVGLVTS